MDERLPKLMEEADRHRLTKEEFLGASDTIARHMAKLRLAEASPGTTIASIMEKLQLPQQSLGASALAGIEAAGLTRQFNDSKVLNDRVMAAFGPARSLVASQGHRSGVSPARG